MKNKDVVLVELYNAEDVSMVTEYLMAKQNRRVDMERKKACAKRHTLNLILKAYRKGA